MVQRFFHERASEQRSRRDTGTIRLIIAFRVFFVFRNAYKCIKMHAMWEPYGAHRVHMGSIWHHMGPYGPHMVPIWSPGEPGPFILLGVSPPMLRPWRSWLYINKKKLQVGPLLDPYSASRRLWIPARLADRQA